MNDDLQAMSSILMLSSAWREWGWGWNGIYKWRQGRSTTNVSTQWYWWPRPPLPPPQGEKSELIMKKIDFERFMLECLVLISVDFYEFFSPFSPSFSFRLRGYIKRWTEMWHKFNQLTNARFRTFWETTIPFIYRSSVLFLTFFHTCC